MSLSEPDHHLRPHAQPLTTFTDSIDHGYDLDFDVIFTRLTKAFPCCQHVISVRDLKPTRVTDMITLEITTRNSDGTTQTFICKIPARPELWSNIKNSIALREKLDSPMVPNLYRVISVKGLYNDDPDQSMPVIIEENLPHNTTVETDTEHLANNPAQYLDSFIINSLQLFHQMAAAGYAMLDNTNKNIAVLDEAQFAYFDLGSIEPLIKKSDPTSRPTNNSTKTLERFVVILQNFQKKLTAQHNTGLTDQLQAFITYLNTYLESMSPKLGTAEEEVARRSRKQPITKERIISDLETIIRTYMDIRTTSTGPRLQISPPAPRNTRTPSGLPSLPMRVVRAGVKKILGT